MEKKAKMTESAKSTWKGRCGAAKKAVAKKADVNKKVSSSSSTDEEETDGEPRTSKRVRSQYQPFQSPEALAVLAPALYKPPTKPCSISKNIDDKIVIFGKGDFLAVRNDEGTFYVCRTAQNVYKSSRRFKIQWLNDEKEPGIYVPDFYDQTNFECVLTNLTMDRKDKNRFKLPVEERKRTMNILERAINVEKGLTEVPDPRKVVSDGVDVSIVGKEEEQELIKISPKPSIKVAKEKPAKVNSSRSKRSSLNGLPEREASPKERRGSSETNNSKPTPSTSVKRERKSLNQTTDTATPTTEDRRHTRSSSRSFKEDIKPSPIVKPSSSSSSSSSPLIKTVTPSRKRSLRNIETPNTEEVKSGVTSPKSHSKRSNHTEVEQPESMRLVNMHTHETKRPKIRITCSDHLVDVRIKVPLDNIKTETAVNFIQKYCSQKIVTVIEKRMEYLNKNSPLPLLQSSPPQTPMTSVTSTHQERDDQEPEPKKLKTEEKDLKENDKGFGAMEVDSHEPDKPEENEKDLIEKELKDIANMQKEEKEKLEKERVEEEKAEKAERERIEEEKVEKEKKEKLEKERVEKEKLDKEKKEKERLEKEKLEKERLEKERTEKEKLEKERVEKEKLEKEKLEKERVEKEKSEKEKLEKLEKEKLEKEKSEKEKLEKERLEKVKTEKERLEKEKAEKERVEKEKAEKERLEKERLEKEKAEKERLEKERIQKEKSDKEKQEKEKAEKEKIEKEKAEKERLEKEKAEKEKIEKEREEKEKEKEKVNDKKEE